MLQETHLQQREEQTQSSLVRSNFSQIWHLFLLSQCYKRPMACFYEGESYQAVVAELKATEVVLHIPNFVYVEQANHINIEISHANFSHQLELTIIHSEEEHNTCAIPHTIAAKLDYSQQDTLDFIHFPLRFTLDTIPYSKSYFIEAVTIDLLSRSQLRFIMQELCSDLPNLQTVYALVVDYLRNNIIYDFNFHVYARNQKIGLVQAVILNEKKTFFISDVRKKASYCDLLGANNLTNLHQICKAEQTGGTQSRKAYWYVKQCQDLSCNRKSYAIAPLWIFDTVVGFIGISTTLFDQGSILKQDACKLDLAAKLMSYAMSKATISHKYFHASHAQIVAIDKYGLSFKIKDKKVYHYLQWQKYLSLFLELEGRSNIELKAKIIQSQSLEQDEYRLKTEFYQIKPESILTLDKLLYECNKNRFQAAS